MAVSEIHAARITVNRMIAYIMKDKDETVQSEREINQQYHHEILERGKNGICVRYFTQSSFHRCIRTNPYRTFKEFQQKFQKDKSTQLFLSTITYSFYNALFAPLIEGVELDIAKSYITKLTNFYNDGILAGIK